MSKNGKKIVCSYAPVFNVNDIKTYSFWHLLSRRLGWSLELVWK